MPTRFNPTSEHARTLGAGSAKKAGEARMASMSPKQKTQFQKQAANARWSNSKLKLTKKGNK